MSYDRSITVFSPDGHLLQVEYAMEAVKRGAACVGVRGKSCVVLGVEKRAAAKLQDPRTLRKLVKVDDHVALCFAGLNADARVAIDALRVECLSHRLTVDDPPTVKYVARYAGRMQQRFTQKGGVRPYGISTIIAGVDTDGTPALFCTDPSGTHSAWKANAVGRNSKSLREFLEKHYEEDMDDESTLDLAVKTLLEVVESGAASMELMVLKPGADLKPLTQDEVKAIVKAIEDEAAA